MSQIVPADEFKFFADQCKLIVVKGWIKLESHHFVIKINSGNDHFMGKPRRWEVDGE